MSTRARPIAAKKILEWAGKQADLEAEYEDAKGRHPRINFAVGDKTRFVVIGSGSKSDGRAVENSLAQAKRTVRELREEAGMAPAAKAGKQQEIDPDIQVIQKYRIGDREFDTQGEAEAYLGIYKLTKRLKQDQRLAKMNEDGSLLLEDVGAWMFENRYELKKLLTALA